MTYDANIRPIRPQLAVGDNEASELLKRAIAAVHVAKIKRVVFLQFPRAQSIFERVAWFVTDEIAHESGPPLIHLMIKQAFERYAERREQLVDNPLQRDLFAALISGLFQLMPYLLEVEVRGRSGQRWEPLDGVPLGTWMRHHKPYTIRQVDPTAQYHAMEYRSAIATKLLQPEELAKLGPLLAEVFDYPR